MKGHNILWAIPLLGMLATPAIADRYDGDDNRNDRFEQRLDRQHWRIEQGVRSGELTGREVKRLRKEQRHIAKTKRKFSRDGYLDRKERRQLRRKLNRASDRIYRLKQNERYRVGHQDRYGRYDLYPFDRYREPGRYDDIYRYDDNGWSVMLRLLDYL